MLKKVHIRIWVERDAMEEGRKRAESPMEAGTHPFLGGVILLTAGMKSDEGGKSIFSQQEYMKVSRLIDDNKLSE